MDIECYAQRLLNPYRGVVHTIRYRSAEAVTTDGVEWDIYVANDALLDGLGRAARRAQISDIRYGHWSAEKGLKRGALYPSEDFRRMEEMGAVAYEYLRAHHRDVPFPFRDRFELWLLDGMARPLALLHSVFSESETENPVPLDWRAGLAAAEHFTSRAAGGNGESAAARLTREINARAGRPARAQWFLRSDDGTGLGLRTLPATAALEGRIVEAGGFAPLFLSTADMDAALRQLVEDYHAWQAPWMLLLPHLDAATRRRMERHARDNAEAVEKHCRLYPETIDRALLQAARVEAALVRNDLRRRSADEVVPMFYIELDSPEAD